MEVSFTKMHGLGNDFVIINNLAQQLALTREQITQLADRHTGIGFDQLLLVEPPSNANHDFTYRIFNIDGNEVGQCGNGARCLAAYVRSHHLTKKNHLQLATTTGDLEVKAVDNHCYSVNMGIPKLLPEQIPFITTQKQAPYSLTLDHSPEQTVTFAVVNIGNPHAVIKVNNCAQAPVNTLGPKLAKHTCFPESVNVGFMEVVNNQHIKLRVYERGVGETLACGSGAVAAAIIGYMHYNLTKQVTVSLPGGDLNVSWESSAQTVEQPIWQTGPASLVFEGTITL